MNKDVKSKITNEFSYVAMLVSFTFSFYIKK